METSFGKLVLVKQGKPEQEFELSKNTITIGRAMTNDVILDDVRVSRGHARLDCSALGCTITDMGSSNGTRVNGERVQMINLVPGDVIHMGGNELRFESGLLTDDPGMTRIDTEADIYKTLDMEVLPMAINETSAPRLVVFTGQTTYEVFLGDVEIVALGREETCEVFINHSRVSRRHAEVVRRGDSFLLKDLGSTNGTWLHGERVDQVILQDGDSFRVGPAQVVFKSGFEEATLTLAEKPARSGSKRSIVVFLPGLMGSELWLGNERVWPNVKTIISNPDIFRYPSNVPLEPRGIVDEVVIVPNLIKQDQYNRLGDYLVEDLHYQRGVDFFEFAYDWRQDVRTSAHKLGELIQNIPSSQPVVLIAHSLGTMVSRYYVECLGGKKRVARMILMGGPHQGAVKGLTSMLVAPQVLPFGIMGERLRQIVLSFPTSYQILPTYEVAVDQHGKKINFLEEESWLDEDHRPLLRAGREFRRELGMRASVPAISIFGYGIKTISDVRVVRDESGKLLQVSYTTGSNGDASVLEKSAFLDGTEIHPVRQYHGSLFVDNDVKMRLKLELTRPYA
jgi:pSer/pThr/pTyr-binding forkhead associated (FHA) protein